MAQVQESVLKNVLKYCRGNQLEDTYRAFRLLIISNPTLHYSEYRPAPIYTLPLSAFGGALLMTALIYSLAWNQGSSPILLILMGIGLSAIATAITSLMITYGEIKDVSNALVWLAGSVYGRTWEQVFSLLPWLIVFVPMALTLARHLNALNLGDDVAKSLGSQVEW